jgi:hypothetical protein
MTYRIRKEVILMTLVLTACGGGGGGTTPAANTATAEGVYSGSVSNGNSFDGIVLEDGSYYVLAGPRTVAGLAVIDLLQGSGVSSNGIFSSLNLKGFWANGSVASGSISSTYAANSFAGTVIENGVSRTFSGAHPAASSYVYNNAANLANITGAWTLADMQGGSVAMTITPTGSFTASGTGGCVFSGTFSPRASGKNVFNFLGNLGVGCALPSGTTFSGIAIEYLLPNATRQFVVAGVDVARLNGTALFGVR